MLRELFIKNFALISELRIDFEKGLNIITGETGSGKSIMIDALSLCLGGRGDKSFIKRGEKKSIVEAVFTTENKDVKKLLEENNIDFEDELIICRELGEDGRSVARLNSRNVNLYLVKEVAKYLLNIHGQNDYNYLYDSVNQLKLLDSLGGEEAKIAMSAYENEYVEYKKIIDKIKGLDENRSSLEVQREKDFLGFVISDIDSAKIYSGELESLDEELSFLKNSEKIFTGIDASYSYVYGAENNVLSMLNKAIKNLEGVKNYYRDCEQWSKIFQEAYYQIEDSAREMGEIKEHLVYDEKKLDLIHSRISQINTSYRKYGGSYESLTQEYEKAKIRLEEIENRDEIRQRLENLLLKSESELKALGENLSGLRQENAKALEFAIISELDSLAMSKVIFNIDLKKITTTALGMDSVEFLISFNQGEEPKPMAKIASGGETSRFMLSLKSVISKYDSIDTLLFDEIDTGVSGLAAENIGKKLKEIGKSRQIICITHLPQIAACAHTHFKVEKTEGEGSTTTTIGVLHGEAREIELAKMMSGSKLTSTSLENAKELLELNQGE